MNRWAVPQPVPGLPGDSFCHSRESGLRWHPGGPGFATQLDANVTCITLLQPQCSKSTTLAAPRATGALAARAGQPASASSALTSEASAWAPLP